MINTNDTIASIASGLTHSGIGIIRISGPEALAVADRVFRMRRGTLSEQPANTVHYGYVYDGENRLDECLAVVMRAPHSYTAEDVAEIQCHGGPLVMRNILDTILRSGARNAEPGEFTKRAFLNGRIDLSQAEAVMNIIQAQNDAAALASVNQIHGSLSREIREIRGEILEETAYIEAALDDPEHISLEGYSARLKPILATIQYRVRHLIDTADEGRRIVDGIRTVILGRPNAGKSSLLNTLLGEERAIVTNIPGTTRDTLEETINMGGFSLRLVDTAGIRSTEDAVEKIGVERARKQAEQADLIIYIVDSSEQLDENDREIIGMLTGKRALVLMNKIDLKSVLDEEYLHKETGLPVLAISAKEGTGIGRLKEEIRKLFDMGEIHAGEENIILNLRHKEALLQAERSLQLVENSLSQGMPEDFLTIDLMDAYISLGRILGEEMEEDLIDEIFSKFCMGK